ncbi:MAG: hypothetical protein P0S94_04770 [Simkaniaceae bacterium]|nr:hypothetical protein [Simkaniaceae bacterium]
MAINDVSTYPTVHTWLLGDDGITLKTSHDRKFEPIAATTLDELAKKITEIAKKSLSDEGAWWHLTKVQDHKATYSGDQIANFLLPLPIDQQNAMKKDAFAADELSPETLEDLNSGHWDEIPGYLSLMRAFLEEKIDVKTLTTLLIIQQAQIDEPQTPSNPAPRASICHLGSGESVDEMEKYLFPSYYGYKHDETAFRDKIARVIAETGGDKKGLAYLKIKTEWLHTFFENDQLPQEHPYARLICSIYGLFDTSKTNWQYGHLRPNTEWYFTRQGAGDYIILPLPHLVESLNKELLPHPIVADYQHGDLSHISQFTSPLLRPAFVPIPSKTTTYFADHHTTSSTGLTLHDTIYHQTLAAYTPLSFRAWVILDSTKYKGTEKENAHLDMEFFEFFFLPNNFANDLIKNHISEEE